MCVCVEAGRGKDIHYCVCVGGGIYICECCLCECTACSHTTLTIPPHILTPSTSLTYSSSHSHTHPPPHTHTLHFTHTLLLTHSHTPSSSHSHTHTSSSHTHHLSSHTHTPHLTLTHSSLTPTLCSHLIQNLAVGLQKVWKIVEHLLDAADTPGFLHCLGLLSDRLRQFTATRIFNGCWKILASQEPV